MDEVRGISIEAAPESDLPDASSSTALAPTAVVADHFQFLPLEQIGQRRPPPLPHELHENVAQISYRLQGDPAMYTKDALERRQRLSSHSTILACIDLFWNVVRGPSACITRQQYMALHLRLTKALHREFHVHHARTLSMHDALKDLGQAPNMTKDMFRQALFEVVDHWTLQIDLHHYVDFLIQLFLRISELRPGIDANVSIQDLLLQMLSGGSPDAASRLMQLRLLNDVAWMEQGPDGDWTQQVPGSVRVDDLIASHSGAIVDDVPRWIEPKFTQQFLVDLKAISSDDRKAKVADLLKSGQLSANDILYMLENGLITPKELASLIASNPDVLAAIGDPARLLSQLKPFLHDSMFADLSSVLAVHGIEGKSIAATIRPRRKTSLIVDVDARLHAFKQDLDDDDPDHVVAITPDIPKGPEHPKPNRKNGSQKTLTAAALIPNSDAVSEIEEQRDRLQPSNHSASHKGNAASKTSDDDGDRRRDQVRYAGLEPTGSIYRRLKKELYARLLQERIQELQMEPATMNGLDRQTNVVWDTDALTPNVASHQVASVLASLAERRPKHAMRKPLRPLASIREAPSWKVVPAADRSNKYTRYRL